jgi:hypothetical protein
MHAKNHARLTGPLLCALALLLASPSRPEIQHPPSPSAAAELPESCRTGCATRYGEVLGVAPGGVTAYSNCSARCVVPEPNRLNGTYTGLRWQCVEFARRWLLETQGVVYGDVDVAADIWSKTTTVTRVADGQRLPFRAHLNGSSEAPKVGDLLVYSREYLNTGHVAVVTAVDREVDRVEVAEQNFRNEKWPDSYARRIDVVKKGGRFWVLDPYLIGWKRVASDGTEQGP